MSKKHSLNLYLRCVISYTDISHYRILHYAVNCDCVDSFTQMIMDTFVHPDITFTDIIFSYDNREFFQLI